MKRIVVLGAGESGTGAAILAKSKGMDVFVSDMGTISPVYQALLDQHQIAWESGKHTPEFILNADEVIKSPGIPLTAPLVKQLIEQGTPILSEIVLNTFLRPNQPSSIRLFCSLHTHAGVKTSALSLVLLL